MLGMDGPDSDPEWQRLLTQPRRANSAMSATDVPARPGVYAWFQGEECVYVGKATRLRSRLNSHRRTSADLSRSTLRASVAVTTLGVTRAHARSRPSRMTAVELATINAWFETADVAWVVCETPDEADAFERRLRATWMPSLNLA
jgi:excinuclease UvrABC nuclease subunit